jgi:hypothetical protein
MDVLLQRSIINAADERSLIMKESKPTDSRRSQQVWEITSDGTSRQRPLNESTYSHVEGQRCHLCPGTQRDFSWSYHVPMLQRTLSSQ